MAHVGPGWALLKEALIFRICLLRKPEPSECGKQGKRDAWFPSLSSMSQGHCVLGPCEHVPFCHHSGGARGRLGEEQGLADAPKIGHKGC